MWPKGKGKRMTKSPAFPQNNKADLPPFLNDGQSKVKLVDARIADGPPNDPIPAYVFDLEVAESSNPMNQTGKTHTVRIKCRGFSWGAQVQEIVSAVGLLPKSAISAEVAEALIQTGKLKGRRFVIEQTTNAAPKKGQPSITVTWRDYRCAALESSAAI